MSIAPRARFYAMMVSQIGGSVIIASGMACYWFGLKGGTVPNGIKWRSISLASLVFLMAFIPLMLNIDWKGTVKELARKEAGKRTTLSDRPRTVRILIWTYCFVDLGLLTYLVHITGGLSGSVFAGVYVVIPAIAIILIDDLFDVKIVVFLILAAIVGIGLSFLMSSLPFLEGFKASDSTRAFDLSLFIVTFEAMLIPLVQILILWNQLEGTEVP